LGRDRPEFQSGKIRRGVQRKKGKSIILLSEKEGKENGLEDEEGRRGKRKKRECLLLIKGKGEKGERSDFYG